MTTLREAVAQALDALTKIHPGNMSWETGEAWMNAVQILREAMAQPEPEPFGHFKYSMHLDAWVQNKDEGKGVAFYTHPPQRKPLTEEQVIQMALDAGFERNSLGWTFTYGRLDYQLTKFARAIERAHSIGEKE